MKITKVNNTITEGAKPEEKELEVKLTEAEDVADEETVDAEVIEDEDMIVDDVLSASVSEIADAVQDAAEVASDGKETYSDSKAEKVAGELKTAARGLDRTKWAPLDEIRVTSAFGA